MKEIHITDNVTIYNDMPIGWCYGKHQPSWHRKASKMWKAMWVRVYKKIQYFGTLIDPKFKLPI